MVEAAIYSGIKEEVVTLMGEVVICSNMDEVVTLKEEVGTYSNMKAHVVTLFEEVGI